MLHGLRIGRIAGTHRQNGARPGWLLEGDATGQIMNRTRGARGGSSRASRLRGMSGAAKTGGEREYRCQLTKWGHFFPYLS
jgi:hypothetical protein